MQQRTLDAVARSLKLSLLLPHLPFKNAVTDSRNVDKADLFFALAGEKTDGHLHLQEVAEKGAIAAVVNEIYEGPDYGLVLLKVPHVLNALQNLAKQRLEYWRPIIVAITGSVGKTTTKEFIAKILSTRFSVGKAPGNANSQVGLPLTILNLEGTEEVLVLEMGMTHRGQIANLVTIAPPSIAVITKIGMAHAGNFENGIEGVAEAKGEILSHPQTQFVVTGKGVSSFKGACKGSCKRICAGVKESLYDQLDFTLHSHENAYSIWEKNEQSPSFPLPFSSSHFLENFSVAVAVARTMGLKWEEILRALPDLRSTGSRFAPLFLDGVYFINDAYNASPESVRAALDNLPVPQGTGRRIAVLAGMTVDLGPTSDDEHRKIAMHALEKADLFFCYGRGSLPMKDVFEEAGRLCLYTEDKEELAARVFDFVKKDDVVLVKGANRYSLWQIFNKDGKIS